MKYSIARTAGKVPLPFAARSSLLVASCLGALVLGAGAAAAAGFNIHPLVTDDQTVLATLPYGPATTVDPNLVNPRNMGTGANGHRVIANARGTGGGIAGPVTVYTRLGAVVRPSVHVPDGSSPPYGQTGLIHVAGDGFKQPKGGSAAFVIEYLDGSIADWTGRSDQAGAIVPGRGPGGNLAAYTSLQGCRYGREYLHLRRQQHHWRDRFVRHQWQHGDARRHLGFMFATRT